MTGEELRTLRTKANVSGGELSRRLGKHRSWCSKAENENWSIDPKDAKKIARILNQDTGDDGVARVFNVAAFRAALEKKHLSVLQLSKLVGVNPTNAYKWVNQGAQPRRQTVELIAETLEVALDNLYVEQESPLDGAAGNAGDAKDAGADALHASRHVLVPMSVLTYRRLKDAIAGFEGHTVSPVSIEALSSLKAALDQLLPEAGSYPAT